MIDPQVLAQIAARGRRAPSRNVLGGPLAECSRQPVTGFYRNGCCDTGPEDLGRHVVCVQVTAAFLTYSQQAGNDLSTPNPRFDFPGLQPGARWCLCAERWQEALDAGVAPPVVLAATHETSLEVLRREDLEAHALDLPPL